MRRLLPALSLAMACAPRAPQVGAAGARSVAPTGPEIRTVGEGWTVYTDGTFGMAFPSDWQPLPPSGPARFVALGNGIGLPAEDEHGDPLQVGLAVEAWPGPWADLDAFLAEVVTGVEHDPAIEQLHRLTTYDTAICGTWPARMAIFEFDKAGSDRRSQYLKLVALDRAQQGWIALGWSVAGRDSALVKGDGLMVRNLEPWLRSFCPEVDRVDLRALQQMRDHPAADAPPP